MIRRLLIANRGEIAVRIARAAREAGIVPLGIYSRADEHAYHLEAVDAAQCVGEGPATDSYLNIASVIAAARTLQADAVHPGYGFLSENATFAPAVGDAGMVFVGPAPAAMAAMGSKIEAKRRVRERDVPVVPGYDGDDQSRERLRAEAHVLGTPLLIKASAGGGGRGMRVVDDLSAFDEALEGAQREARGAFGDETVLLERYLRRPRHIEFQILGDRHGAMVHLGERECSIQRRHQKVIEEAPSVALDERLRAEMGAAAVRAAQSVGYTNAGTVEFILEEDGRYYFLEMNTRLQVEHPVTELVYGVDLVQLQFAIANGERLALEQTALTPRGWAIEARIYAEDPAHDFLPSSGTLREWSPAGGPGVRVDGGVRSGSEIPIYYDPMLAKLIVWAPDRAAAVARMERALSQTVASGVRTNLPFLSWIVRDEVFRAGALSTRFLEERFDAALMRAPADATPALTLAVAALLENERAGWRIAGVGRPFAFHDGERAHHVIATRLAGSHRWRLEGSVHGDFTLGAHASRAHASADGAQALEGIVAIDATGISVTIDGRTTTLALPAPPDANTTGASAGPAGGRIAAPMPGRIAKIAVAAGAAVRNGDLLIVLEAMKMEHRIEAPGSGAVTKLHVKEGDLVSAGSVLVELSEPEARA